MSAACRGGVCGHCSAQVASGPESRAKLKAWAAALPSWGQSPLKGSKALGPTPAGGNAELQTRCCSAMPWEPGQQPPGRRQYQKAARAKGRTGTPAACLGSQAPVGVPPLWPVPEGRREGHLDPWGQGRWKERKLVGAGCFVQAPEKTPEGPESGQEPSSRSQVAGLDWTCRARSVLAHRRDGDQHVTRPAVTVNCPPPKSVCGSPGPGPQKVATLGTGPLQRRTNEAVREDSAPVRLVSLQEEMQTPEGHQEGQAQGTRQVRTPRGDGHLRAEERAQQKAAPWHPDLQAPTSRTGRK